MSKSPAKPQIFTRKDDMTRYFRMGFGLVTYYFKEEDGIPYEYLDGKWYRCRDERFLSSAPNHELEELSEEEVSMSIFR